MKAAHLSWWLHIFYAPVFGVPNFGMNARFMDIIQNSNSTKILHCNSTISYSWKYKTYWDIVLCNTVILKKIMHFFLQQVVWFKVHYLKHISMRCHTLYEKLSFLIYKALLNNTSSTYNNDSFLIHRRGWGRFVKKIIKILD